MKSLRWFLKKMMLILVAIMIGVSNAIFEEDEMVNSPGHQTEKPDTPEDDQID